MHDQRIEPIARFPAPSPVDAIGQAERHYTAGQFAQAAELLQHPDRASDPSALGLLGLCRLRSGDLPSALGLLREAADMAPRDALLTLRYGIGLQAAGRHREAVALFRAAQAGLPMDPAPLVNLCGSYIALGQPKAAVAAARRAVRRAPGLAAAHYMLGRALAEAGRHADVLTPLRKAVSLAPGFTEAWVSLGVAFYLVNDLARAEWATRQALAVDPNHESALVNLASFFRMTGRSEACDTMLRAKLQRTPGAASIRNSLAADRLSQQRPEEALALLDGPVPADATLRAQWRLQQCLALTQLERPDEARVVLDALRSDTLPASLAPLLCWRELLLASPSDAPGRADAMAEMLTQTAGMVPEHRLMGWYDLARFWSIQRDPARAMACWTKGHALLGLLQPFDRAKTAAWLDAVEQVFDRNRLRSGPVAVNEDAAPVFIVGMPRSGTTLCEQILAAHPLAHGAGERSALQAAFDGLGGDDTAAGVRRVAEAPQSAHDATAWDFLHELHALAPGCKRVVDKMPANFRLCGLIHLLFPRARIIHCVRDPRDIGLSIFTFRFYGHHSYAHDLGDLGWYIARERQLMAHWDAVLPGAILPVRLDDWVNDFDATLKRVLDHVGLPWDAACERFYESKSEVRTVSRNQVRQPINARGLGRWRPFRTELEPLIAELRRADIPLVD